MDKSFDFGKLLQLHEKKHKSKPVQFSSVAVGVKLRLDKRNNKRKSSRLTIFDKIRNIPKCESPVPPKPDQKTKLEHRMKQLQLWKQEKEKKKMQAALNKKKPFLAGVAHNPIKFVPPPPPKPMPSTSGRVTRSQTKGQKTEIAKTSQKAISNVKSFAPKNATFNPTLNIVKLPLQIPSSNAKKVTSKVTLGLKTDNKTKSKPLKSDFGKNNRNNAQSKASDSSSSVGSSLPIAKTRVLRKRAYTVQSKKVPLTSESSGSLSSSSPKPNTRPTRKINENVKTTSKAQNSTPESSNSDDAHKQIKTRTPRKSLAQSSSEEADGKQRTPRTSLPNSRKNTNVKEKTPRKSVPNLYTPVKPVPKSESSSEEKLRSPKQAEVSMTPEQIVEVVQKLPSPCVTMSRGKANARKEMKKKIDEGLLDDDVCEMDSLDHFKQQLDSEIKRMTEMCKTWDKISEQVPLPEAVQEAVLGAVGQARLLMSQKMQQFASLLARAECPEPGTALVTPTDLHGFWDMVFMQVENIDMRFKKLEEMRARNWADEPPPPRASRRLPRPSARPAPAPRTGAVASRIKDLIAAKRKEKKQAAEGEQTEVAETKTFDAGFFSVRSPVRSPRAPATPRRSLLHHVLSSEAKKASASKNSASYAMLRASSISKNVDSDDTMFTANQVQLTPVNLFATPARSILKSVNNKSTKKSGKKSIKMVLFNNSDTDIQNVSDTEKVNGQSEEGEMEKNKQENRLASDVENKPKSKLIRQDAVEDRSPVMTRSRRKSVQTPSEDKTDKTPRRARRKHALQEIEVNIVEEQAKTPKRSTRRKSSIKE
ncbi:guanylate kinase-associated protein mars [Aricia agestis]|uniref:guanylate kinase-associated protein mars n=1 Tax=Aricia agestis TaxID=91739 RepID=UPI001C20C3E8|nr:guanylate kinase-associated protein mars [Aricia agestis]XP_041986612.1 guanylate kinase-associated protein mars [Aricia agestis]